MMISIKDISWIRAPGLNYDVEKRFHLLDQEKNGSFAFESDFSAKLQSHCHQETRMSVK